MIEEIFCIQRETEKKVEKLNSLIGQKVRLTFNDGTTEEGILEKEQPVEGLSFSKKKYSILKSDGSRTFFSKSHVKRIWKRWK